MNKNLLAIILCVCSFNFFSVQAEDSCNLIVGSSDYKPLTYDDAGNNVIGMDVELLNIIAKQANCNITWAPTDSWKNVLVDLSKGKYTLVTSASYTTERAKFSSFIPYRPDSTKIFIRKSDIDKFKDIHSLEDLVTKTKFLIGMNNDYQYGSSFSTLSSNEKYVNRFISTPGIDKSVNLSKLITRDLDAVILETVIGIDLMKKDIFSDITFLDFEINDPGISSFSNLMISRVADPKNRYYAIIKNAVEIVKNSDEYRQVIQKYLPG